MRRRWIAGALVAALTLGVGLARAPAGLAEEKGQSPQDVLKESLKALGKAKSFALDIECAGGLASSPSRTTCDSALVRRSYATEVVRPLQKVADPESWLFYGTQKGATRYRDAWRQLLATEKGKELPYLARTPESVLATAIKYAKKQGVWLDETSPTDTWAPPPKGDGSDTVARGGSEGGSGGVLPSKMRVIGPAEEALKLIVEVQHSGCLDGG